MPHIHSTHADGTLLIRHNPGEGTGGTETVRDIETFNEFCDIRRELKKAKRPIPSVAELFPDRVVVKKTKTSRATHARDGEDPGPTLFDRIGTKGQPGPHYLDAAAMQGRHQSREGTRDSYVRNFNRYCAHLRDVPISQLTDDDVTRVVNSLHYCRDCFERAIAAGRTDLLSRPDRFLMGTEPAWDGACVDEKGDSTHYVYLSLEGIKDVISQLRFTVDVAIWSGDIGRDPSCGAIRRNVFRLAVIHEFERRPRAHDYRFALSHVQVRQTTERMPDFLQALVPVATFGMFRHGEILALMRSNIEYLEDDERQEHAVVTLSHTVDAKGLPRPFAKTNKALGHKVYLPPFVARMLRDHMARFRSMPNPDRCQACRDGFGEHEGTAWDNPHRGCDLANDAPVWLDPDTGIRPTRGKVNDCLAEAATDAGVVNGPYTPTMHALRRTGATLRIENGEPIEVVMLEGRWSKRDTVIEHYTLPTAAARMECNAGLDPQIQAAWGIAPRKRLSVEKRLKAALTENAALRAENARLKRERTAEPTRVEWKYTCGDGTRSVFGPDDLRYELPKSKDAQDLCIRLGTTGSQNSINRALHMIRHLGLQPPW